VISLIGFLCVLYSYEYMIHDDAQGRYYFWMLTFPASMLLLVTANSPLVLLLAWELTGLCSFSLIAHWNFKRSALSGAYKALVITELGSGFLLLGLVLANVHELSGAPSAVPLAAQLLVLIGALAKSAQYPLLLWLPDAMEAPTPVSAYLHAAAMVKAGFYILLRLYGMIEQILPLALLLGCISTLAGGLLMLFARDIKRVLAYSTISHLGLLFSTVSVGGILPALLYFLNHAVAKALLFLSAGAVEHETGRRNIDELGGLASARISGSRSLSLILIRDALLALTIISLYLRSGKLTLAQAIEEVPAPHALLLFAFFTLFLLFSSLTTLFSAPLAETEILEGYLLEYSGPLLALAELSHWLTSYAVAGIASAAALRVLGLWLEGLAPLMHLLIVILLAFLLASTDAVFARLRIWGSVKLAALTLGFLSTVSLALSTMRW